MLRADDQGTHPVKTADGRPLAEFTDRQIACLARDGLTFVWTRSTVAHPTARLARIVGYTRTDESCRARKRYAGTFRVEFVDDLRRARIGYGEVATIHPPPQPGATP